MHQKPYVDSYLQGTGIEIGAFDSPIPGTDAIYIDKFREFAGQTCLADYLAPANQLPVYNASLDYVAHSHVFEHLANPVQALLEWQRVLRPGGYLYMVVPDRRYTFDKARELTPAEHMVEDFLAGTDDRDPTHIDDFVFGIDWEAVSPGLSAEETQQQRAQNAEHHHALAESGEELNIHFHVFEPGNFEALLQACQLHPKIPLGLELCELVEKFPTPVCNGFLAVLRKPPGIASAVTSRLQRALGEHRSPIYPLQPHAEANPPGSAAN